VNQLSTKFRLACVAALFACASAAGAADFTFNVPVSLKSISPEYPVTIKCFVFNMAVPAGTPTNMQFGGDLIGEGRKDFTLKSGAYEGTVTVSVDSSTRKNPADARGYRCLLQFTRGSAYYCFDVPNDGPCRRSREPGNSVDVTGVIKFF
jgi:hypothetical protein